MFIERIGSGDRHYVGVHGWSGNHRTFLPLAQNMPRDISLWCVDLPGCGRSGPPEEWTLEAIVDELAEQLAATIPEPATMVGNCSGAILSMLLASRAPRTVLRLVLIDAFAAWPWYFRVFTASGIGQYAYRTTFANPVGRWVTNLSLTGKRQRDTNLTQGFGSTNHEVTLRYINLFRQAGKADRFKNFSMPIDILYGEKTFRAVRESAAVWKAMWPHATEWILAGAGHLPLLEATARVQQILFEESPCPVAI
ncbi:MAG: alpha/beta hydrolase [Acidobacteriota bacterium]|nr:alpha/beta hydrolase [Acidobacteriota bacterium]